MTAHDSNTIVKFADNTTLIGLISNNDETAYREEVQHLTSWQILVNFYRCTIESILTNCVTVWYGNCSAYDRKALQRVVETAQCIGSPLPSIEAIQGCVRRAASSKTVLIPTTDCSPHSPPRDVTGLSALEPAGSEEASFLWLSLY